MLRMVLARGVVQAAIATWHMGHLVATLLLL